MKQTLLIQHKLMSIESAGRSGSLGSPKWREEKGGLVKVVLEKQLRKQHLQTSLGAIKKKKCNKGPTKK